MASRDTPRYSFIFIPSSNPTLGSSSAPRILHEAPTRCSSRTCLSLGVVAVDLRCVMRWVYPALRRPPTFSEKGSGTLGKRARFCASGCTTRPLVACNAPTLYAALLPKANSFVMPQPPSSLSLHGHRHVHRLARGASTSTTRCHDPSSPVRRRPAFVDTTAALVIVAHGHRQPRVHQHRNVCARLVDESLRQYHGRPRHRRTGVDTHTSTGLGTDPERDLDLDGGGGCALALSRRVRSGAADNMECWGS
ncbi:hypothetical protein B0H12DRAFT_274716 [Mycena haematopus]|nr:hypothetical protein B0H12DRAFT_274716 [Mycena haematopus]